MKKILTIAIISLIAISSCKNKTPQNTENKIPHLQLVWETDTTMTTCESVIYHKESGLIYVANINHNPWKVDHNGFISKLDTEGNIRDQFWLNEGLSGPKGMGIIDGRLYVNDINQIVEIDMASGNIVNNYPVKEEVALNDITTAPYGTVYSSNSATGEIYALKDGELTSFTHLNNEIRLNGLYYNHDKLYFLASKSGQFGCYNFSDKSAKVLTNNIGWGDGIIRMENGDFLTSSWKGEIYHINHRSWKATKLLDLKRDAINTADIDYIPEKQLLIVPTFFHNTVRAYKIIF